jgi:riboflavin synthase
VFTGLIESVGKLERRSPRGPGARIAVVTGLANLVLGESIAVSGCCLTVDAITPNGFEADASAETLAKTTLGAIPIGSRLNLERALTLQTRLGGHIVTGHVDGVGTLVSRAPLGEAEQLTFRFPAELGRFIAAKGSITVDGISLTVNEADADTFKVAIIPHTKKQTQIGDVAIGGGINLEVDLLARYVLRMLEIAPETATAAGATESKDSRLLELLRRGGYV